MSKTDQPLAVASNAGLGPDAPDWLLPGDAAVRIANEHRIRAGAVQAVARQIAAEVRATERDRCVAWVDARRDAFCAQFGSVDPDTGTLEFGRGVYAQARHDHMCDLMEIADGLRALGPNVADHRIAREGCAKRSAAGAIPVEWRVIRLFN